MKNFDFDDIESLESLGGYHRDTDMEDETDDLLVEENPDFEEWFKEVLELLEDRYGIFPEEVSEEDFMAYHDEGLSPEEAVKEFADERMLIDLGS
ncbi:MAG: hypothetical protein D6698_15795 [Gammaproteobacteria bacterium]|nr:MAG: hypothetical protein D6698_15795 [Gammaproteobacteria bacterium]